MTMTLSGSGSIGGLVAGGLPDASVTAPDLASGAARTNFGAGAVLQVQHVRNETSEAYASSATSLQVVSALSKAITPSSASSNILVEVCMCVGKYGWQQGTCLFGLARDGSTTFGPYRSIEHYGADDGNSNQDGMVYIMFSYLDSPNTTSAVTYAPMLAAENSSYAIKLNSRYNPPRQNGISYMKLTEIAA